MKTGAASYLRKQMFQPSSPCGLRRAKSVKAFYEARLTAYEAALRAMKRTFGA